MWFFPKKKKKRSFCFSNKHLDKMLSKASIINKDEKLQINEGKISPGHYDFFF
jgi:hypothetical protein